MLAGLAPRTSGRVAPTGTPERHQVTPRVSADHELQEAIAAVRAGADWGPGASGSRSDGRSLHAAPRAQADDELREAIAAVRAGAIWSPGASGPSSPRAAPRAGIGDDRDDMSAAAHTGTAPADVDAPGKTADREALLDMVWDTDSPHERVNDILTHYPDLVDATDHRGDTLLTNALTAGNIEFAKTLIAHGADVQARDEQGNTPLHLAAKRYPALVAPLLEAGADPKAISARGATPLFTASSPEALELLVRAGAPVDQRDRNGDTAALRLAQSANRDTVLALLGHNPDLTLKNRSGHTFAQILTARFGGAADAIPTQAYAAKAFLELAKRESPFLGNLRDRKSSSAARQTMTRPGPHELRVAPDLTLSPSRFGATGRPAINNLKSGQKMNFVADPLRAFDELDDRQVETLSEALGFGKLSPDYAEMREQRRAIRETFGQFAKELDGQMRNYNNAALRHPALADSLSREEMAELEKVMNIAHLRVAAERLPGGGFREPLQLRVLFEGTQNARDFRQDISSAFGRIGEVDRAAKRAGELFAKILSHPERAELDFITGMSMGGAMAQTFRATVESRVLLPKQPSMILLDPQLLNNNQARRATKDGHIDVDYSRPRGVALTLDYAKDPRRGLTGIMKGPGGYRYPGLVHLKLGLTDTDGPNGGRPKTSGPPGLGYHADGELFRNALSRFSVDREHAILDNPALDEVRAPRWASRRGPLRTSDTLPAIAKRGRLPMASIAEED
jgi:ankyrin repeat protein